MWKESNANLTPVRRFMFFTCQCKCKQIQSHWLGDRRKGLMALSTGEITNGGKELLRWPLTRWGWEWGGAGEKLERKEVCRKALGVDREGVESEREQV